MKLYWIFSFQRLTDCYEGPESSKGNITCSLKIEVYNWNNGECRPAIYGGCNPSMNLFKAIEECEEVAGKICESDFSHRKYQDSDIWTILNME